MSKVVVWDSEDEPPAPTDAILICRWDSYAEGEGSISLFRYIEEHSDRLRKKYLAWIHDLGETIVDGKRIIDHFVLHEGLSYWWMTLFVEQDVIRSDSISKIIRLIALEEILNARKVASVELVSNQQDIDNALENCCHAKGIAYFWRRLPDRHPSKGLRAFFERLPKFVQGGIWLTRTITQRWKFRKLNRKKMASSDEGSASLFIYSYLMGFDSERVKKGEFRCSYWGALHAHLNKREINTVWLQQFIPHGAVPRVSDAVELVSTLNTKSHRDHFLFPDAYLSLKVVGNVVVDWFRLIRIASRLKKHSAVFHLGDSNLALWPLMEKDWESSFVGVPAVVNLLWLHEFDKVFSEIPRQKAGFYLCENLSFERALIYAWRKHGHGVLVGVPHSSVRYWDLRYFNDFRILSESGENPIPKPDFIALNGEVAVEEYLDAGFDKATLVKCEALRYLHLNSTYNRRALSSEIDGSTKVLVLTDYTAAITERMMRLLVLASELLTDTFEFYVKCHPAMPVDLGKYPTLRAKPVVGTLEDVLQQEFDIVFASNTTTAVLDACLAGLRVVAMLDDKALNFSPLRSESWASFVSTPEELSTALMNFDRNEVRELSKDRFFFLDNELPRWNQLLTALEIS